MGKQWWIQGFREVGCQSRGGANLLFGIIFADKMKQIGLREGACPWHYTPPPHTHTQSTTRKLVSVVQRLNVSREI